MNSGSDWNVTPQAMKSMRNLRFPIGDVGVAAVLGSSRIRTGVNTSAISQNGGNLALRPIRHWD